MKSKKCWFVTALTACLTLSLGICAEALEYNFDGVEDTEYYPSTSYESLYGAKYNYGGSNATDYQWPALPYGVSSNTSVGCMEKVRFPGLVGSIGGSGIESNITNPIQQEPQIPSTSYADTLVLDHDQNGSIISAIRFGGYPEMVRAMADAIYGGATIEAAQNDTTRMLQSSLKSYQRQITHDGIYAVATLMAADTVQEDDRSGKHEKDEDTNLVDTEQMELQPRRCYIFCPARDQKRLFEELDHKTAAPLIPEFQDYVLSSLRQRGDLRQLEVISLKERIDAWVLDLKPQDQNVVEVLERGLQSGDIQIPGAVPNMPDGFENVENVTGYLNTFGVTVADRIRSQFMPLFDPAKEPLSDEVLATSPSAFRYAVRYEGHTDLAPYEFFECCNEKSDDEILGAAVQHYDVVEIDDGIKPAFFYKTEHGYELLFSFDAKIAKKNIREEID